MKSAQGDFLGYRKAVILIRHSHTFYFGSVKIIINTIILRVHFTRSYINGSPVNYLPGKYLTLISLSRF